MTRDSKVWWVVMIGSVAAAVLSHMNLLDPFLPAASVDKVRAGIELIALIAATIGGKMATSPLPGENDANTIGGR